MALTLWPELDPLVPLCYSSPPANPSGFQANNNEGELRQLSLHFQPDPLLGFSPPTRLLTPCHSPASAVGTMQLP